MHRVEERERVYAPGAERERPYMPRMRTYRVTLIPIGFVVVAVIVGVVLMIVWSFWIGLIIALVGLLAYAGLVRAIY
jgi:uncharacterized membrane protein YdbT with pleckstrin-like domain